MKYTAACVVHNTRRGIFHDRLLAACLWRRRERRPALLGWYLRSDRAVPVADRSLLNFTYEAELAISNEKL